MNTSERVHTINKGIELLLSVNQDIISLVSIGSFSQDSIDQFSDIDLYLFTNNPIKYLDNENHSWINPLGKIISRRVYKDFKEGVDKNKVILKDGLMYDLTIIDIKKIKLIRYYLKLNDIGLKWLLPKFLQNSAEGNILKFYETIKRGYKIHVDKINLKSILERNIAFSDSISLDKKLDKKIFFQHYNFFWQSCYTASIKLIRRDFYFTILTYDHYMKKELIRMIEWDAALKKKSTDVFYDSLKIYDWSGEETYEDLNGTLLSGTIYNMQNSLIKTTELYQKFSSSVSKEYKFSLNKEFENFVIDFIKNVAIPEYEKQ
ncbi:aminoglycoside 6-adenylyltransferase [Flavobacterium soyae]|uniref:aminoglycoside 6-adenylyltransferase n=1 Tax=Flavobacterium soyae TaxID=2903098 RepID=UPI001E587056|nr:aminoglycoside 6-adenylyltransferase [Flavobacterium soyae]MCD9574048.1 aminoglycoside 6-adenylyltransferase [Flavobacterium soyae]